MADAVCIVAGAKAMTLAVAAFTLSWTHSVEKTRWEEDWVVAPDGLHVVVARVKGSGAGMDPPEGSVLKDGWWVYEPHLPPQPKLDLAASGATGGGWRLCHAGGCLELGTRAGSVIEIAPCRAQR